MGTLSHSDLDAMIRQRQRELYAEYGPLPATFQATIADDCGPDPEPQEEPEMTDIDAETERINITYRETLTNIERHRLALRDKFSMLPFDAKIETMRTIDTDAYNARMAARRTWDAAMASLGYK